MTAAKVHVTKLAAAERQLRSAIRLYFAGEDELAVHTVASAAYRLLADLKSERGRDEATDVYQTMVFYAARSYRRGNLPNATVSERAFIEWARTIAEQLTEITTDSKIEDFSVTIPRKVAIDFWRQRSKIANFLKHADRDSGASISLDQVDNLMLLMQTYSAYTDITRDQLGNEGLVFQLFLEASQSRPLGISVKRDELVQRLAEAEETERLHVCSLFIAELARIDAEG